MTDGGGLGDKGDAVYAALMATHDGLDDDQSQDLNARLILLLLNALNDPDKALLLIEQAQTKDDA